MPWRTESRTAVSVVEWESWFSFHSASKAEVGHGKDGEGQCVIGLVLVTFLITVIKCPTDETADREKGGFGSQFEVTVHHSREDMVAGTQGSPSVTQLENIEVNVHIQLISFPHPACCPICIQSYTPIHGMMLSTFIVGHAFPVTPSGNAPTATPRSIFLRYL
jgi:hypothetical protein